MSAFLNSQFAKKGNKIKPKRIRGPALVARAQSACYEMEHIANLFRRFPYQHDISLETWDSSPSTTTLQGSDEQTPIDFTIRGSADEFIHPMLMLRMVFQVLRENGDKLEEKMVTKADGKVVVEMDKVVPINFFHNTMWKQVDVKLNDTMITLQQNTDAYTSYIRLLTEFGDLVRANVMETALYAKEDSADIHATDPTEATATTNFKWRAAMIKKSTLCEVNGPLLINGLVSESHLIPPNVDLQISLHRAPAAFALLSPESNATKYKINITEAEIHYLRLKPYPESATKFSRNLNTYGSTVLPLLLQETRAFSVASGTMNVNHLCWDGRLPTSVDVVLLDTLAFNGAYHRNPLAFGHYGLKTIGFEVNGRQVPAKPFKIDFNKNHYTQLYLNSVIAIYSLNRMLRNAAFPISYEEFAQSNCIMRFQIAPNALERVCRSQSEHGTLRLKMDFPTAIADSLTVLVIGHIDRAAIISKDRSVRLTTLEEV